jgi:hypothetical protein
MARLIIEDSEKFPRVNTRITRETLARLNYACQMREKQEPRTCPQGTILAELIMEHLPPAPDGEFAEVPTPRKKAPKSVKRGRPPKAEKAAAATEKLTA